MSEAIDYNALNWVRQELDEVLKQARSSLEHYAGNRDDGTSLQDCAKNLHQARGPLRMVALKGADQLASEMEELIADLLQASLADDIDSLERRNVFGDGKNVFGIDDLGYGPNIAAI